MQDAEKNDAINVGLLTQNADRSALESFRVHRSVAQEENKEDKVFENLIAPGTELPMLPILS